MSWSKVLAIAGVLAAQATAAMAADMPKNYPPELPLPTVERPRPVTYNVYSGWYLRGDLGYQWATLNGAQSAPGSIDPSTSKLGNGVTGGIGAGFKHEWVRTDFTIDFYAPMNYTGTIAAPGDVTAKISAWSVLFNGYLDLGTWYRASPYIGVGAGAGHMSVSGYTNAAAPPIAADTSTQWNFAYAGMAGIGYRIAANTVLDLGYRYINFGDVKSPAGATGSMTFKNVAAHEVRVGLRWSFDDLPITR